MEFNVADLFESVVDALPNNTALVCGEQRLTFRELDLRANRLAHYLASRGIGAGDHIGLYLYNGCEFLETLLAAFKIRAVPININYRYVASELAYLCDNADLVALVHQRELSVNVAAVPGIATLIAVDDQSDAPLGRSVDYERALAEGDDTRGFAQRSPDDLYIIYTGGTTGMPRGVMWRHEDVFFAGLQGGNPGGDPIERPEQLAENVSEAGGGLTFLPAAPFIHGAAQWAALICWFTGGKVVIVAGRSYDAARICALIEEEEVNTLTLVGDAMVVPIVEALEAGDYDTSSLIVIPSAGAILSPTVKARLQAALPDTMILNSFGASETGHQASAYPTGDATQDGKRLNFFMDETNTVFDDDLARVSPGSGAIGRLARRGHIPLGYYGDPEKTARTFVEVDGVRWVLPGDLATIEADGSITVFGRGSQCINTGGEKVFPEEVEEVLKAHPAVVDALVVGVPDDNWGQRVAAVVHARNGVSLAALAAHCRESIAGYKVPRELHLVDRVQRQPSGKPDYPWARRLATGSS